MSDATEVAVVKVSGVDVHVHDLRGEPIELADGRWTRNMRRNPQTMKGIVVHTWDTPVGTQADLRALHGGEGTALAFRALAAPYGVSAGVGEHTDEAVVALAHPLERYTYASDAANRDWVSVGVMGLFATMPGQTMRRGKRVTQATPAMYAAVDVALMEAVKMLPVEGRPYKVITHRQGMNSAGDHAECPGLEVLRMVLASSAVREGFLIPDPDLVLVERWSKPWPAEWRALLDAPITAPSLPEVRPMVAMPSKPLASPVHAEKAIEALPPVVLPPSPPAVATVRTGPTSIRDKGKPDPAA